MWEFGGYVKLSCILIFNFYFDVKREIETVWCVAIWEIR